MTLCVFGVGPASPHADGHLVGVCWFQWLTEPDSTQACSAAAVVYGGMCSGCGSGRRAPSTDVLYGGVGDQGVRQQLQQLLPCLLVCNSVQLWKDEVWVNNPTHAAVWQCLGWAMQAAYPVLLLPNSHHCGNASNTLACVGLSQLCTLFWHATVMCVCESVYIVCVCFCWVFQGAAARC